MTSSMESILNALPRIRDEARSMQDIVLANLVAIGEVPAPYQHEEGRVCMMLERFSECGLQNCSTDATGNEITILPGTEDTDNILLFSNVDTLADEHSEPDLDQDVAVA